MKCRPALTAKRLGQLLHRSAYEQAADRSRTVNQKPSIPAPLFKLNYLLHVAAIVALSASQYLRTGIEVSPRITWSAVA